MAVNQNNPSFRRDSAGTGTYFQLTKKAIASSVALSDLVIADYDAAGDVRGIEFVGKQTGTVDSYIAQARKLSPGATRKLRGPVPDGKPSGAARSA